jgi:hypothetical protein
MLLGLLGCETREVAHKAILGKWKSNAELTLKSMNSVEGVTPKARELFESDFFGNLVIEIQEDESRATDLKENVDFGFEAYEVLEVTEKFIRVNDWSEILQEYQERVMYLEGECYYVLTTKWKFREYFCRYES